MTDSKRTDILAEAAEQINSLDIVNEGIISTYDASSGSMRISRDYYEKDGREKNYSSRDNISDPFSLLHYFLYQRISGINCIAIFRSMYTMLWAQTGDILPHSILHLEHFYGAVPCTGSVHQPDEDKLRTYEEYLADDIAKTLGNKTIREVPAILLRNFGAIVWGQNTEEVCRTATILELVAETEWKLKEAQIPMSYLDYDTMNRYHTLYNKGAVSYEQPYPAAKGNKKL